jgi:hypothetical protein
VSRVTPATGGRNGTSGSHLFVKNKLWLDASPGSEARNAVTIPAEGPTPFSGPL